MNVIKCGIYKITSPTNKIYIGQSINIYKRWKIYNCINSVKNQIKLYNSFKKYGKDTHIFEILFECERFLLNFFEIYFINLYNSFKMGLNCNEGGNGQCGIKQSKETKRRQGIAHKGLQAGKKHGMYGKTHTNEAKIRISEANKGHIGYTAGQKLTNEHKQKMSNGLKLAWQKRKNHENYYSEENIVKRSTPKSEETKKNMKLIWKKRKQGGKFNSEEEKIKRIERSKKANNIQKINSPTLSLLNSEDICKLYKQGITLENIALKYNVSRSPIRRILVENRIVINSKWRGNRKCKKSS